MAVTAQDVKELRQRTGVGMMTCKKALDETNGDIEKAIEILRKKGAAKAASKADREAGEGTVAISGRNMVKLLCETDFVAKNESFMKFANDIVSKVESDGIDAGKEFFESIKTDKIQEIGENILLGDITQIEGGSTIGGYIHTTGKIGVLVALEGGTEEMAKDVAMHAAAMSPSVSFPEDVASELIEKEKEIALVQLKAEGKPEKIMDNIIAGKIKKFCGMQALSTQAFVKDPSQTVAQYLGDAKLVTFTRFSI